MEGKIKLSQRKCLPDAFMFDTGKNRKLLAEEANIHISNKETAGLMAQLAAGKSSI